MSSIVTPATHQQYMQRALNLAQLGQGRVSPNPMVGCVIVHEGTIIGEGYHQQYGKAHAEVNAIEAVKNKSLIKHSSIYVSLEPCSHFGKTPPCADLLIAHQPKKVFVCNPDPNPLVAGKGMTKLKAAGIDVEMGLLSERGLALNKRFFTFIEKKRPYIVLKWAQTTDGFMAPNNQQPLAISGALAKRYVHKWRGQEAAIMVGTNTAKFDNPQLNLRVWQGNNPVRVLLDKDLSLDASLFAFDSQQPSIRYNLLEDSENGLNKKIKLPDLLPQTILQNLYLQNIQSVLIEGGAALLNSFIEANLWDEARFLTAPMLLNQGLKAPTLSAELISTHKIESDFLAIYER